MRAIAAGACDGWRVRVAGGDERAEHANESLCAGAVRTRERGWDGIGVGWLGGWVGMWEMNDAAGCQ